LALTIELKLEMVAEQGTAEPLDARV